MPFNVLVLVLTLALAQGAPAGDDSLAGHWTGRWVREGSELAVTVEFLRSGDGWTGSFDADQLRVSGIPLSDVRWQSPKASWELVGDATTMVFEGTLAGGILAGTYREGEAAGTFTLARAAAPPERPREEEVTFHNGDVALAGTVLLPRTPGPHPGVVFLHGSGAEGRWASRFLATQFVRRGIAALVYDKRGVGGSGGDWRAAGFEDLAGDAAAAVAALRRHREVAPERVGIHGHSQGGTWSPLVAARVPDLAFIVGSAASGLPMDEVEIFSIGNSIGIGSLPPEEAALAREYLEALVATAYHGAPRERLLAVWQKVRERPWAFEPPPAEDAYWEIGRRAGTFDPLAHWRQVAAPVLLVYGSADARVPPRPSAARITEAVVGAGRGDRFAVRIFPGADHTFRLRSPAGTGFAWPRTAPGYPEEVVEWVARVCGR